MKETMGDLRLELQRLVDGALSTQDRSALLRRIDESPELWRVVALQFLEDQALRSVLGTEATGGQQVVAIQVQGDVMDDAVASKSSLTETRSNHPLVSEPATKIPTSAVANVPRGWAAAKWLAVAATVFAILGAYQAGNQAGRGRIERQAPQQSGLADSFMKPQGRLLMPVGIPQRICWKYQFSRCHRSTHPGSRHHSQRNGRVIAKRFDAMVWICNWRRK